jgi:hypothetical protein
MKIIIALFVLSAIWLALDPNIYSGACFILTFIFAFGLILWELTK